MIKKTYITIKYVFMNLIECVLKIINMMIQTVNVLYITNFHIIKFFVVILIFV